MRPKNSCRLAAIVLLLCLCSLIHADNIKPIEELHLSAILPRSNSFHGELAYRIYSVVFKRLDIKLQFEFFPARRANAMLKRGELDGDIARTLQFGIENPELTRVQEPAFVVRLAAYGLTPDVKVKGWKSLENSPLQFDCLDGYTQPKERLTSVVPLEQISFINGIDLSFKRLIKKRTDVYVGVEEHADSLLRKIKYKNAGIQKLGWLGDEYVYLYLHKKHSGLAILIGEELQRLKKEGVIKKIEQDLRQELGLPIAI